MFVSITSSSVAFSCYSQLTS